MKFQLNNNSILCCQLNNLYYIFSSSSLVRWCSTLNVFPVEWVFAVLYFSFLFSGVSVSKIISIKLYDAEHHNNYLSQFLNRHNLKMTKAGRSMF